MFISSDSVQSTWPPHCWWVYMASSCPWPRAEQSSVHSDWCHHPHHAGTCYGRLCTFKVPQIPGNKVFCEQRRSLLQWLNVSCPLKVPPQFPGYPSGARRRGAAHAVQAHRCQLAGLPAPARRLLPGTAHFGCSACLPLPRQQFVCSFTVRLLVFIKLPVMKLPLVTSLQLLCWLKSGFRFATAPVLPGKV